MKGGKSTYIRQVALIVIMGQIGSAVPASSAKLTVIDKLFTRMGARDEMEKAYSTFFVELLETSQILKQSGERTLAIIDELGRGTSTNDGESIAFSSLFSLLHKKCFILFVTHYPHLTQLSLKFPTLLTNSHMTFFKEEEAKVESESKVESPPSSLVFLYKLREGVADKSFGLNVARLAFGNFRKDIIENATKYASAFEQVVSSQSKINQFRNIFQKIKANDISSLQDSLN